MTPPLICLLLFACVTGATTAAALLFQRWQAATGPEEEASAGGSEESVSSLLAALGSLMPARGRQGDRVRRMLFRAGHRSTDAILMFHGVQTVASLILAVALGWAAGLSKGSLAAAFVPAVCGLGFGYMVPNRILEWEVKARAGRLRRALPSALDLIVLALEAGQNIDQALQETAQSLRRVYPDLCSELTFCSLEMRAGTARPEALRRMAERCGEEEIRKLVAVLLDGERFGTSLGPALRTHAHYLRTRMRQKAQETARKLTVKLVIPVFFLIFPAVLVVTLGPAYLQLRGFLDGLLK